MAIFNLRCKVCTTVAVRSFKRRPVPPPPCANCGGGTDYEVNTTSKVVNVIDSGLQPTQVTQIEGVKQLLKDRAREAERPDPVPVKLR